MRTPMLRCLALVAGLLILLPTADATTLLRLDLEQLVGRADKIFRGTVLDVEPGTIEAGGGTLPTTTYTLRVDEALKGDFGGDEESAVTRITMIGSIKKSSNRVGDMEHFVVLPDVPLLEVGNDYLLFTTPESSIGLSTAVGLGQGAFSIIVQNRQEYAINAFGNANLGATGAIPYRELVESVRALLGN